MQRGEGGILTAEELEQYRALGYLAVDRPLLAPVDLAEVQGLLDPLFARWETLPAYYLKQLEMSDSADGGPPEINRTSDLEPRLRQTAAYSCCRQVAQQVLGAEATLVFDHAIYKQGRVSAPTRWHQDLAYTVPGDVELAVWIPLQDVGPTSGCMRFVPGSHQRGLVQHNDVGGQRRAPVLVAEVDEDIIASCPVRAGGVTLHHALTVHSSAPNLDLDLRRAWILNFGFRDQRLAGAVTRINRAKALVRLASSRLGR